MVGREPFLYYTDIQDPLALENRTIGVQILIFDGDGNVWIHDDPDGGRRETHRDLDGNVQLLNARESRKNSVSGGIKPNETPRATAFREMKKELGDETLGNGLMYVRDDLPLFMHGQIKDDNGYLIGIVIAEYYPDNGEIDKLKKIGSFVPTEELLDTFQSDDREAYRPAFSFAMELWHADKNGWPLDWVGDYSKGILTKMVTETWDGMPFHYPKIFKDGINEDAQM